MAISDERERLLERLNAEANFPAHGRTVDEAEKTFLVLPFIRATWERYSYDPPPNGARHLTHREIRKIGYFQGHFWPVMSVLANIAADESVIVRGLSDEPSPMEDYFRFLRAHETLPLWVDLFYFYFRMLADRLCVALGYLASEQPGGWPPNFRSLITADVMKLKGWKVSEAEQLHTALQENRGWFDLVTTEGHKGVRDAIAHKLSHPRVVTRREDDGTRSVIIWREEPSGYDERDMLGLVRNVVGGFCSMLSVLPVQLWADRHFVENDLVGSDGLWPAVDRFFPPIARSNSEVLPS